MDLSVAIGAIAVFFAYAMCSRGIFELAGTCRAEFMDMLDRDEVPDPQLALVSSRWWAPWLVVALVIPAILTVFSFYRDRHRKADGLWLITTLSFSPVAAAIFSIVAIPMSGLLAAFGRRPGDFASEIAELTCVITGCRPRS